MDGAAVRAAAGAFLGEALGWPGSGDEIGASLDLVQDRAETAVYAAEIETGAGDVAILVFAFPETEAGRDARAESVQAMLEAANIGTPGPRIVAEGEVDEFGLLLATTPAGLAILTGEETAAAPMDPEIDPAFTGPARARAADALLDALREANQRASDLLGLMGPPGDGERPVEERALALFLLDPSSLSDLTRVMRRLVEEAAGAGQPK